MSAINYRAQYETRTRVTFYVPNHLPGGLQPPDEVLEVLEDALVSIGGGLTLVPGIGLWNGSGSLTREPVTLYIVDVPPQTGAERIQHLAELIRLELEQDVLYVTVTSIDVLEIQAPPGLIDTHEKHPTEVTA